MANIKHYYVICTIDDEIVSHGVQKVDIDTLYRSETGEERAMTDYFDATEIAYNGEYDDDDGEFDWDRLTRYVGEIDPSEISVYEKYTDADAQRLIEEEDLVVEGVKKQARDWKERTKSFMDNDLFTDFAEAPATKELTENTTQDDETLVKGLLNKIADKKAFGKDFNYEKMELREVSRNYWPGEDVIGITLGVYIVADAYNIEVPEDIDEPDVEDLELEDATFDDDTAIQAFTHGMTTDIDGYSIIFQEYDEFEILGDDVDIDWNSEEDGYVNGTVDGYVPVILSIEPTTVKESITKKKKAVNEGLYDYELIEGKDKISEEDLYKALVTDGELVAINAGDIDAGEGISFSDGGVYCDTTYEITEYDGKFSVTAFYTSDDGDWKEGDSDEFDSFDSLCAFIQENFPGLLIESKIKEEVEEPDNAVVDCKVNKVIAHCEDEKPVDCLGKKKPLEKPLTEDTEEDVIYFSKAINDNVSVPAADLDQFKKIDEEVCKIWEDAEAAGLIDDGEEEQKLCDQYGIGMFSGVELLDSLATKAGIFWEPVNDLDEEIKMTADELKDKYGTDDVDIINAGREEQDRVELKESRSAAEIKAEIEKLQQELAKAEVEEKKASYGGNVPTEVWIWDVYLEPEDKGTWTSAELYNGKYDGYVFETEDEALDAAWLHLGELEDEGELEGDPDDYYVEAFAVPVSEVAEETLSESGLDHLIVESLKESRSDVDTVRIMAWCAHNCAAFFEAVANNAPKTKQRKLNKEAYKAMQAKFGLDTPEAEELMGKGYALWKHLYWKGKSTITEAAQSDKNFIVAADGITGGEVYYIGNNEQAAQKEFKDRSFAWSGADTPLCLYEYSGPADAFDKVANLWKAGKNTKYSENIEELGISLKHCKVLKSDWGD
jgi:hypothetical protein